MVGIAAIIASLVFVGLQLRQAQEIALTELGASIHASRVETNAAISDHAEVWSRGNAGEELTRAEEANYLALLHSYHWRHVIGFNQRRRFGETQVMASIVADFAIFLVDNPGARKYWSKVTLFDDPRRTVLGFSPNPNNFMRAVQEALATLDASEADQ